MTARRATRSQNKRKLRFRRQPRNVLVLTAVFLVLVGQINLFSVLGGLALAVLVTRLFPLPPVHYRGTFRIGWFIYGGLRLIYDLAVSSFRLAAWSFRRQQPRAAVIKVDLKTDSDLYQVATAELTSVVPGSIVVDARRSTRTLYVHVFDATAPNARENAYREALDTERRVARAFASDKEIERAYGPDGLGLSRKGERR
ncbi:Na+/H+ antiporter subunit E [Nigerium massiliense]|uniref:Na+/H+ antiporter subunit E n=1 Tax=Nigerium massiliense TaxID=1522317 RepID=UPI000694304E|nr:Na+/H+ antiporter subunit E [Nigerium massiliense]